MTFARRLQVARRRIENRADAPRDVNNVKSGNNDGASKSTQKIESKREINGAFLLFEAWQQQSKSSQTVYMANWSTGVDK